MKQFDKCTETYQVLPKSVKYEHSLLFNKCLGYPTCAVILKHPPQ
jgi:hypothetical protein